MSGQTQVRVQLRMQFCGGDRGRVFQSPGVDPDGG
jgi:hypothetical protein